MDYIINKNSNLKDLENTIYNMAYDIYIKKSRQRGSMPNTMIFLDNSVCRLLGLQTAKGELSGRKHGIKRILKIYGLDDDAKIISFLENKYGKKKLIIEKKQEIKNNIDNDYEKIVNQFDEKFIEFIKTIYKTKKSIVDNKDKINNMYKSFKKPNKETLLSAFALETLNDSHGFDNGTVYRNLLKKMLIFLYNNDNLSNHNLYQDVVSNSVYTRNIILNSSNYYDIISLLDVPNVSIVKNSIIYMYENNGVLDILRQKYPDRKIISIQGHPNTATKNFIKRLINNKNKIYYSGDLDLAGLKIADNLINEFPEIILKDMDLETYYQYSDKAIISPKEQNIRLINNFNLKKVFDVINQTKKVINQEVIV